MGTDQDSNTKPTPGEAIKSELERRGWTHDDLARIMGRHRPEITAIVAGKRGITIELAVDLATAFSGTSPEYWVDLETSHQLQLAPTGNEEIKRRLKIYQLAPIKEMEKRGWIIPNLGDSALEKELEKFFGLSSIDQEPRIHVAARGVESDMNPSQRAWCFRAKQLASALPVKTFDRSRLGAAAKQLRQLAAFPKESRKISETMRDFGIRFVVVEPLSSGKIDGAAFWLDESSPVIAVSIRFDRVDAFWFTVMHELGHIVAGDALSVDSDLAGDDYKPSSMKNDAERRADDFAGSHLIPTSELESFIRRVSPLYSKERIIQFAHRIKIHPGIIVGQLQHRGEIGYSSSREMLVKVRDVVTETSLTDGYGRSIAPGTI